jgi:predicted RecB family nuclease
MQKHWDIVHAMLNCRYKAWTLAKNEQEPLNAQSFIEGIPLINSEVPLSLSVTSDNPVNKLIISTLYHLQKKDDGQSKTIKIKFEDGSTDIQYSNVRIAGYTKQIQKLITELKELLSASEPPPFYKNPHCAVCQFEDVCYKKLKERDCISLLAGMSPKVIAKFHKKGVYSIAQLSHLFRPRRRRRHPQVSTNYLWELKALAVTEQKTFVLYPPDIEDSLVSIYIDFEGIPKEGWIYLIGVLIVQQGEQNKRYSFWADTKEKEKEIFKNLFSVLNQFPEGPIYHYGSYEHKALKQVGKKWLSTFKSDLLTIELRLVNLLMYLRTHVYPPIYTNGLKELARFLGFHWSMPEADGLRSLHWRNNWENKNESTWKDILLQYNYEDCVALSMVRLWLYQLATNADNENIQQVAEMKKQSLYKFQNNPELGADFQFISKAAYFDYQRTKIYWRNKEILSKQAIVGRKPQTKQGSMTWQPK